MWNAICCIENFSNPYKTYPRCDLIFRKLEYARANNCIEVIYTTPFLNYSVKLLDCGMQYVGLTTSQIQKKLKDLGCNLMLRELEYSQVDYGRENNCIEDIYTTPFNLFS